MKLLYLNGFSQKEAVGFRDSIYYNILKNMITVVEQADRFGYKVSSKLQDAASELRGMQIQ